MDSDCVISSTKLQSGKQLNNKHRAGADASVKVQDMKLLDLAIMYLTLHENGTLLLLKRMSKVQSPYKLNGC